MKGTSIELGKVRIMYDYKCSICGCSLDPAEKCDCQMTHERNLQMVDDLLVEEADGQMKLKEAANYGTYPWLR